MPFQKCVFRVCAYGTIVHVSKIGSRVMCHGRLDTAQRAMRSLASAEMTMLLLVSCASMDVSTHTFNLREQGNLEYMNNPPTVKPNPADQARYVHSSGDELLCQFHSGESEGLACA